MKGGYCKINGASVSFVADSKTIPELNAHSRVSGNFHTIGVKGDLKLTKRCLEVASMKDAAWLKCSPGEPLLMIETLRLADGVPFASIQIQFLHAKFPPIYQNYQAGSLHDFIREHYAINLLRSKVVNAKLSQDEDALKLKLELGRPLIRLRSLNVNQKIPSQLNFLTHSCAAILLSWRVTLIMSLHITEEYWTVSLAEIALDRLEDCWSAIAST